MKDFEVFVEQFSSRLKEPLPGRDAQILMAPKPISESRFNENPDWPARPGGVMVLLYPKNGSLYLPLMKRPEYDGHHSGQVSFPGGKFEKGDSDLVYTALRETQEEIGVSPDAIQTLGNLSELFIIASNFKVLPTVGVLPSAPSFIPDATEVERVIEVSTDELRAKNKGIKTMRFGKYTIHSPYYAVDGEVVWGATAMMLSELLFVLDEIGY